ncbi:tripartite tricarboxylate transporter substrate binding protein [Polynucleobacter sp. VK25]|uniref:Bug family tripartite tricarboxylate transporter substrate binding protein n=1 Tax=Polynucleobacter sp. VK25 TaxID=1758398 RepID=UPI001BFD3C93|nr:tripartite tricarboxylate transporter substrate binding protein [Polynucleobacter sp. VK25]QWD67795.1 tripartite tricarboxylate transporter substrate binding protein [Polynucleobacter sp. VK25]
MNSQLLRILLLALTLFCAQNISAQGAYPDKTIRMIVPQAAGGPSDVLGRLIAQKLSDSLGKSVIVDNKAGAGGNIGADLVAKSKPDGYTALITIVGTLAINESLYKNLPFDVPKDFDGVSKVASSPMVLVANPAFEPNTIAELIALVKSKPALSIPYGSAGNGSPQHIGGELLNSKAGIKLSHIPYKGAAPALTDLLGGQVPLAIVGLPAALPYIKAGKLKAIAVFSKTRSKLASNIPTFVESGYPEIEADLVYGVFVPAGTPKPIITSLNQKIVESINTKEVKEKLLNDGFDVVVSTPAELNEYLKNEVQKWRPIVRDSGAIAD